MARIVVLVMFFIAVFLGLVVAQFGAPIEESISIGMATTGVAAHTLGRREAMTDPSPTDLRIVGVVFVVIGILLFIAGLAS